MTEHNEPLVAMILEHPIKLPDYYNPIDELPYNPYDSPHAIGCVTKSPNALCLITLTPTTVEQAMPYDNPQHILKVCREGMSETQGVIEIVPGQTESGRKYVYSIVKNRLEYDDCPAPTVAYTLNMDVDYGEFTLSIVGSFEEAFETGVRHAIGAELIARSMGEDFSYEKCFRDPYDPEIETGFLMHLCEAASFDELFPAHPLSLARELVRFFAENN